MTGERSEYTGREVVAEIPSVDVYTSDQDKIGRVLEIGPEWVIVDRDGLFSGGNLWIPANRVSGDPNAGAMYVDCTKDQLDEMGWDNEPEMVDGAYVASGATDVDTSYSATDTSSSDTDTGYATQDRSYADATATQDYSSSDTSGGDTERIRVHEEELQAQKVAQEAGAVRVSKDVVEEQRELDVPVMREEVQVTRHAVTGDSAADGTAFQETSDTIRVPIIEERVEVRKVPHVVEEIEISKRQVQGTEHVSDTVRREEVHVEEEGTTSGSRTTGEYTESGSTGSDSLFSDSSQRTVGQNREDSNR